MIIWARRVLRPARRAWRRVLAPVRGHIAVRRELAQLGEPLTFNEKVRYRMLTDRRPLLTTFADKVAVRAYVESKVGSGVLPDVYAVTGAPETLVRAELPREFVVKPTHGSGACVVVADFAPSEGVLPEPTAGWVQSMVRPDQLSWDRLVELCQHWISRRFSWNQWSYTWDEWCYRDVPRRILIEELLDDGGRVPFDYKLFVFDGRVRMIQVTRDRFQEGVTNLYTPDWKQLDVTYHRPRGIDVEQPEELQEMLDVSEALGAEMDFVRVDLYCLGRRVVFGELTNYPLAGSGKFTPPEFDRWLGDWWTLPKERRRWAGSPRSAEAPRVS